MFLCVTFAGITYIHIVLQHTHRPSPELFHHLRLKCCTCYTVTPQAPSVWPGNHHSASVSVSFTLQVKSYNAFFCICLISVTIMCLRFILKHVSVPSFSRAAPCSVAWMCCVLLVHSPVSGRLDCFYLWAKMLRWAWVCKCQFESFLSFFCVYTQKWNCWVLWQFQV